jgi:hypothetical protein
MKPVAHVPAVQTLPASAKAMLMNILNRPENTGERTVIPAQSQIVVIRITSKTNSTMYVLPNGRMI